MTKSEVELNVVIVGAGLGGLSAAISCALAGHKVTVLESAKHLAEIGAGLQITPNAGVLLRRWGLGDDVERLSAVPTTVSVHRYSGEVLAHEDFFDANLRRKYGEPFYDIRRADLQKLLYNRAVQLGVEVRLGHRISAIHQNPKLEVESQSGEKIGADLIIGADGLWSRCRQDLLNQSDEPIPTGDLAYRIVLNVDQLPDQDLKDWVSKPQVHFWVGPHAHVVAYSMSSGTVYNIVLLVPDDLPADVARKPGSTDEMRSLFTGWDPILTRFLDHVQDVDKWKLMHRETLPSWTNTEKNFVLIGDACHPMLPYLAQGANSSLEDGAVLGRLLGYMKSRDDLPAAMGLYEKLRKARGEAIARETFKQREAFHLPDGPEQEARDMIFRAELGKPEATVKFPSRWTCPVTQPWLYGYDAYKEVDEAVESGGLSTT